MKGVLHRIEDDLHADKLVERLHADNVERLEARLAVEVVLDAIDRAEGRA